MLLRGGSQPVNVCARSQCFGTTCLLVRGVLGQRRRAGEADPVEIGRGFHPLRACDRHAVRQRVWTYGCFWDKGGGVVRRIPLRSGRGCHPLRCCVRHALPQRVSVCAEESPPRGSRHAVAAAYRRRTDGRAARLDRMRIHAERVRACSHARSGWQPRPDLDRIRLTSPPPLSQNTRTCTSRDGVRASRSSGAGGNSALISTGSASPPRRLCPKTPRTTAHIHDCVPVACAERVEAPPRSRQDPPHQPAAFVPKHPYPHTRCPKTPRTSTHVSKSPGEKKDALSPPGGPLACAAPPLPASSTRPPRCGTDESARPLPATRAA